MKGNRGTGVSYLGYITSDKPLPLYWDNHYDNSALRYIRLEMTIYQPL